MVSRSCERAKAHRRIPNWSGKDKLDFLLRILKRTVARIPLETCSPRWNACAPYVMSPTQSLLRPPTEKVRTARFSRGSPGGLATLMRTVPGGAAAHGAHRRRCRLHGARAARGMRPRGGALDVEEGPEPRRRARRGVLRHAQVRLLRGQGLDRCAVRRVLPPARRIYRVI